jgi:hypothetical protein
MSVPASYTAEDLVALMQRTLGTAMVGILAWDAEADHNQYTDIITRTLMAYGAATLDEATDTGRLLLLLDVALWRAAQAALAPSYNISTDGQSLSLAALYDHAKEQAQSAQAAAVAAGAITSMASVVRRQRVPGSHRDGYSRTSGTLREY